MLSMAQLLVTWFLLLREVGPMAPEGCTPNLPTMSRIMEKPSGHIKCARRDAILFLSSFELECYNTSNMLPMLLLLATRMDISESVTVLYSIRTMNLLYRPFPRFVGAETIVEGIACTHKRYPLFSNHHLYLSK